MQKGIDYPGVSVVSLCHDGQGNYLLELRSEKCRDEQLRWSNVGCGALEIGEALVDAVRREVREECGADARVIEPLGYREVFREVDGKKTHWIGFDFKVEIDPSEISIKEPEMCLKQQWYKLGSFPEPLHSQFPYILEKYKNRL